MRGSAYSNRRYQPAFAETCKYGLMQYVAFYLVIRPFISIMRKFIFRHQARSVRLCHPSLYFCFQPHSFFIYHSPRPHCTRLRSGWPQNKVMQYTLPKLLRGGCGEVHCCISACGATHIIFRGVVALIAIYICFRVTLRLLSTQIVETVVNVEMPYGTQKLHAF